MHALNQPQQDAVCYLDGPLLVLAGAGSGKTRVITQKIAHLIKYAGFQARHIAAITFTNKAAYEMQSRLQSLVAPQLTRGLTVSTFHSFGLQILRQECIHLGYKPQFSLLDNEDAAKIIGDMLANPDKETIRQVQTQISRLKNALLNPEQAIAQASSNEELKVAEQYRIYQNTLFAYQAMDFDDLIRLTTTLLQTNSSALHRWQAKIRYLLVDEYQDTNACQYQLIKLLMGSTGKFTAVGDDDQSIYAWRGANLDNLRLLQVDFPQLRVIKLEQNYRSTTRILQAANSVIANNPKLFDKNLWSTLGIGDQINVVACKDDTHEAEVVAIKLLAHKYDRAARFADYAVLYRSNHQARIIEQIFRQNNIPYVLSGGQSFFDKSEIKDVMAYLRLISNEDDDPAFIRAITCPKRGIGSATLEKLGTYAASRHISLFEAVFESGIAAQMEPRQHEPLLEFCQFIQRLIAQEKQESATTVLQTLLQAIDYQAWLESTEAKKTAEVKWRNIQEWIAWLSKKTEDDGKSLSDIVRIMTLMALLDSRPEEKVDAVQLSTLHAAKGLEYGHVFLIGCEEEIIPHRESIEHEALEEERRLMYVGITRAQRSLTITYSMKRKRAGDWHIVQPSRFLEELPATDICFSGQSLKEPKSVLTRSEGSALLQGLLAQLN